jgi:hypothetical protein
LLDEVGEVIHASDCPIWDPTFKPTLPAHARAQVHIPAAIPHKAGSDPGLPSEAQTAVTSVASPGEVKEEPMEIAQAEDTHLEQCVEHPSAASPPSHVKEEPRQFVKSPEVQIQSDPSDFPLDLIYSISREIDLSKSNGGHDVSAIPTKYNYYSSFVFIV